MTANAQSPVMGTPLDSMPMHLPRQRLPAPSRSYESLPEPEHNEEQEQREKSTQLRQSSSHRIKRLRPLTRFTSGEESPGFYLSLSDLMCLLLVFFVLIFSLTEMRPQTQDLKHEDLKTTQAKVRVKPAGPVSGEPLSLPRPEPEHVRRGMLVVAMAGQPDPGLRQLPGPEPESPKGLTVDKTLFTLVNISQPLPPSALPQEEANLSEMLKRVRQEVQKKTGPGLQMESGPNRLIITLPESITFGSGLARIKPAMQATLAKLAPILAKRQGYQVIVTGHTDDVPINNDRFASNWELSAARAAAVGRALFAKGLDQGRLTIRGLADQSPRAPNNNPKNRQINRRVEIELRG